MSDPAAVSQRTERPLVAVIPIRGGSKGLPGKNLRPLLGIPLYQHAIGHARGAGAQQVVVTTDIDEVIGVDHGPDVVVHPRPNHLATDGTTMDPVLSDVLALPTFDGAVVVLLQATSPLRRPWQIVEAVTAFNRSDADLVMSVCEADRTVLKYGTVEGDRFVPLRSPDDTFQNRQALPRVLRPNGAIYVFDAEWFRGHGTLSTDSIGAYEMPPADSWDIDTAADFEHCKRILAERQKETA